jgi:broad specificity phosphatase PhoE
MSVRIQLARHFTAKDIAAAPVPNQYRHLHFPTAEEQALLFRDRLSVEQPNVTFIGHSVAIRAKYSLLLATIGIVNGLNPVEIPNLFTGDDDDGKVIMAACSKQGLNPSKWDEASQEALKRFGKAGATAIEAALTTAGVTDGDALIFSHGPFVNAQAAYLAGGDEETVKAMFAIDTKEGDRFVVEGNQWQHLPLVAPPTAADIQ